MERYKEVQWLSLPRQQLYVHLYVSRDQNYFEWHSTPNPSLPTTLKLFFAAKNSTAFLPHYVSCFDVFSFHFIIL